MARGSFGLRRPVSGLGVDFGSAGVKAVALGWDRGRPVLLGAGREPAPPGTVRDGVIVDREAAAAALGRLLERIGTRSREVGIAVGGSSVFLKRLPLPAGNPEAPEFREHVAREAARHVPFHIESLEFDYEVSAPKPPGEERPAGNDDAPAGIVFGAAPRELVRGLCDAAVACGRQPTRVDLEPYTLFAAARLQLLLAGSGPGEAAKAVGADRPAAFVDVGAARVGAHIFRRGPLPPRSPSNGAGPPAPERADLLASVEAPPSAPGLFPDPSASAPPFESGQPDAGAASGAASPAGTDVSTTERVVAALSEARREAGVRRPVGLWRSGGRPLSAAGRSALGEAAGGREVRLDPLGRIGRRSDRPADPAPVSGPAFAIAAGLAYTQLLDQLARGR